MVKALIIVIVLLSAVLTALAVIHIKQKIQLKRLRTETKEFLKKGKPVLSLKDGEVARLENAIGEIENALLLERTNTEKAVKENENFVADISHQLKTPLAGLRLYCEMDRDENPTSRNQKELELIDKTEKLIYELLRAEKLKSDTYRMNFASVHLNSLISEGADYFKRLFPEKTITVTGDAVLRCDGEWLGEAVDNIIKNSCEHTARDGKIEIEIAQSEKFVIITAKDDGGGVPENELSKLFIRFYRSTGSASGSAGIGLAITKAIVEKHHGTIFAENTAKGLKTVIYLPLLDGEEKIE